MPALDPIVHAPMHDGPTQLQAPMQALPRQEPFQIRAQPARAITMPTKPRPMTHRVSHQLAAEPAIALTRKSNINPDAAGQDSDTSIWGMSGLAADEGASMPPGSMAQRFAIPAVLGVAIGWFLARRG